MQRISLLGLEPIYRAISTHSVTKLNWHEDTYISYIIEGALMYALNWKLVAICESVANEAPGYIIESDDDFMTIWDETDFDEVDLYAIERSYFDEYVSKGIM